MQVITAQVSHRRVIGSCKPTSAIFATRRAIRKEQGRASIGFLISSYLVWCCGKCGPTLTGFPSQTPFSVMRVTLWGAQRGGFWDLRHTLSCRIGASSQNWSVLLTAFWISVIWRKSVINLPYQFCRLLQLIGTFGILKKAVITGSYLQITSSCDFGNSFFEDAVILLVQNTNVGISWMKI